MFFTRSSKGSLVPFKIQFYYIYLVCIDACVYMCMLYT